MSPTHISNRLLSWAGPDLEAQATEQALRSSRLPFVTGHVGSDAFGAVVSASGLNAQWSRGSGRAATGAVAGSGAPIITHLRRSATAAAGSFFSGGIAGTSGARATI